MQASLLILAVFELLQRFCVIFLIVMGILTLQLVFSALNGSQATTMKVKSSTRMCTGSTSWARMCLST